MASEASMFVKSRRIGRLFLCLATLLRATSAQACGADQLTIQDYQSEVDAWSDGSGHAVRLTGYLTNPCDKTLSVQVGVTELSRGGGTLGTYNFWIDRVPPGGQPIQLLDRVPYRADAASYSLGVVRIK
jgi:hypothetical protein